jgi:uncharacterized protein YjbI with pentapeptide repeats
MNKKECVDRWNTMSFIHLRESILQRLLSKNAKIEGFGLTEDGKNDLRGLQVCGLLGDMLDKNTQTRYRTYLAKKVRFINCDFSYADFSGWLFEECIFKNCTFQHTVFKDIKMYACDIFDSTFLKTNFSKSAINLNKGSNSGIIENCYFEESNFRETMFGFPIIRKSVFKNCHLRFTFFNASRLEHVQFEGIVESSFFYGTPKTYLKPLLSFISPYFDIKKYPNRMQDVDFRKAVINGCTFSRGINLEKIKWPDDPELMLIKKPILFFKTLLTNIELSSMNIEDKALAKKLVNEVYYTEEKKIDQPWIMLDKKSINYDIKQKKFDDHLIQIIDETYQQIELR